MAIPFPNIDPIALEVGPIAIRWYGLAYAVGILAGYAYLCRLIVRAELWGTTHVVPTRAALDDLMFYSVIGIVAGGRIGHVLFYEPAHYLANPLDIVALWKGGMSFHGGFIGTALAALLVARQHGVAFWRICDLLAVSAPIGIALGRIANFINVEVVGTVTAMPWGIVFPGKGPEPRHPAMLYEAALEGIFLFAVLAFLVWRYRTLRSPGLTTGYFLVGYAIARIFCELFKIEAFRLVVPPYPITKGMVLSVPMLLLGLWLLWAFRKKTSASEQEA